MEIASETNENGMQELAKKLKTVFLNEEDTCALNVTIDEPLRMGNQKNPLLLSPVPQCVLKFLNFKEIKNFRFVCREWGSTGKLALASRALIRVNNYDRLPREFHSCFLNSAILFNAFVICGSLTKMYTCDSLMVEKLTNFFDQQQKYIKELKLDLEYSGKEVAKNVDLGRLISKSPMVQKNGKHKTKLCVENGHGTMFYIPLQLIAHIKDLTLTYCNINVETGTQMFPIKLKLVGTTFYQDGIKLDRVRLNDIVDLNKVKDLDCATYVFTENAKYTVDMRVNVIMDRLTLENVEILNGETSQWIANSVKTKSIPYSFHSQMQIKELYLSCADIAIDLVTLPTSIQNLTLELENGNPSITCSRPFILEKLEFLQIIKTPSCDNLDCSFLSHFKNCPKLTHLTLDHWPQLQTKSLWIPKSITTLIVRNSVINFVDDGYLNLKKLVLRVKSCEEAKSLCKANIQVDQVVMMVRYDVGLFDFLEDRKHFSFGKTLFIGEVTWSWNKQFEESVLLKKYFEEFDEKSNFYVFEHEDKGRACSKQEFYDLLPKHLDMQPWHWF